MSGKEGCKMKGYLFGTILLALVFVFPIPAMAAVDVGIRISLPPIVFSTPPELIVIPETNVYAVPDLDVDIFFYNGWWWRPWEGQWYRSQNYSSGWGYYKDVPSFYRGVPSGWKNDYREHRWKGNPWNGQRIPQEQVQRNWRTWEKGKHWEKQNTWGVQGLKPPTQSRQPNRAVQQKQQVVQPQRREVRQPQQVVQPQRREVRQPQREVQPQSRPQSREAVMPQHPQPQQKKPEGGKEEKKGKKQDDKK
jgi:hypothetical protein